jgi:hypothetical protein
MSSEVSCGTIPSHDDISGSLGRSLSCKFGRKCSHGFAQPNGSLVSFSCVIPLTPELNPSTQRCLTRFLQGILLLELSISLTHA